MQEFDEIVPIICVSLEEFFNSLCLFLFWCDLFGVFWFGWIVFVQMLFAESIYQTGDFLDGLVLGIFLGWFSFCHDYLHASSVRQFLRRLLRIKRLWVECPANPFQHVLMLRALGCGLLRGNHHRPRPHRSPQAGWRVHLPGRAGISPWIRRSGFRRIKPHTPNRRRNRNRI